MSTGALEGVFISFDGPDGSGKTTQIALLAEWLRSLGHMPVTLRQPGGTALGERIRALLLSSREGDGVAPLTELALMFADRAQSIHDVILPALARGSVVLCDRYTDSSEAYQGAGRGLGSERVLAMHRAICDGLQPQLTVLLLPYEDTLLRAQIRNEQYQQAFGADENRFEAESAIFHARVHAAYVAIAQREPERVHMLTGGDIETVARRVRTIVAERFPALFPAAPSV